jgi:hypothetical protein
VATGASVLAIGAAGGVGGETALAFSRRGFRIRDRNWPKLVLPMLENTAAAKASGALSLASADATRQYQACIDPRERAAYPGRRGGAGIAERARLSVRQIAPAVPLAGIVTGRSFDLREMIAQRPPARRADEINVGEVYDDGSRRPPGFEPKA